MFIKLFVACFEVEKYALFFVVKSVIVKNWLRKLCVCSSNTCSEYTWLSSHYEKKKKKKTMEKNATTIRELS